MESFGTAGDEKCTNFLERVTAIVHEIQVCNL